MQKNWQIHGSLALVGLIYGANYVIAKGVMPDYLSPNAFIVLRVGISTVLFWIYHTITSGEKLKRKKDLWLFAKCAVFGVMANQLVFFNGLNLGSPVNASIIMTMNPIIVLLISYWFLKEPITRNKVFGILLGATGAFLLIGQKEFSLSNETLLGDIFIFCNATFYAIYLVMVKPLMAKYEAATVVKWVFTIGFFMVLPFGAYPLSQADLMSFPLSIWGSIAFVIVGTTFFAYLLNAMALRFVSSSIVGYYIYLQPVFASLIAISIGMEPFQLDKLLCALLIFAGVFMVSRK